MPFFSGAPAARRAARAEPHTHRSWEFVHVLGEPDSNPCISFFMVRVASGMVRGRVTVGDDGGGGVTPRTQGPPLVNKRNFFPRAFRGSPRLGASGTE